MTIILFLQAVDDSTDKITNADYPDQNGKATKDGLHNPGFAKESPPPPYDIHHRPRTISIGHVDGEFVHPESQDTRV